MFTCVNKATWSTFAELFGLVGQCDLHDARNVSRWSVNFDGVRCYQLNKHTHVFTGSVVVVVIGRGTSQFAFTGSGFKSRRPGFTHEFNRQPFIARTLYAYR